MAFVKLSETQEFTVKSVTGYKFKHYCRSMNPPKFLVSESPKQCPTCKNQWGKNEWFQKRWSVEVDEGTLELSTSQFAGMLEQAYGGGHSNIIGRTYTVRNNGKEGMEIRYWINIVVDSEQASQEVEEDIPWN